MSTHRLRFGAQRGLRPAVQLAKEHLHLRLGQIDEPALGAPFDAWQALVSYRARDDRGRTSGGKWQRRERLGQRGKVMAVDRERARSKGGELRLERLER